jgi:hypothetical protein
MTSELALTEDFRLPAEMPEEAEVAVLPEHYQRFGRKISGILEKLGRDAKERGYTAGIEFRPSDCAWVLKLKRIGTSPMWIANWGGY